MPKRVQRNVAVGDGMSSTPLDWAIAALAATQHGVVALAQLVALGITASGVRDRVARGALHRIYRGVFAVGSPSLPPKGRWMAAVLAYDRAALFAVSAGALLGIRPSSAATIDLVTCKPARPRHDIRVHTSRTLLRRDITLVETIPCTTVARTLLDLAAIVDRRGLERACDRAYNRDAFDLAAIEDVLVRAGGHRGAARLRTVLTDHAIGTTETRSPLEERFLAIIDAGGIPRPVADYTVDLDGEAVTVDFAWVSERVLVELDSWRHHGNPIAQARDARRTRRLTLLGWCVLRFTDRDLADRVSVARHVRAALACDPFRLP